MGEGSAGWCRGAGRGEGTREVWGGVNKGQGRWGMRAGRKGVGLLGWKGRAREWQGEVRGGVMEGQKTEQERGGIGKGQWRGQG